MNAGDMDLGSAGLMLIPNTNYVLGGGKQGVLYLADTNQMGGFNSSGDKVRQEFQAVYGKGTSHIHGSPSYFNSDVNGPTTYVWGENDVLRAFQFNPTTGLLNTTPLATSTMTAPATNNDGAMPGGFLRSRQTAPTTEFCGHRLPTTTTRWSDRRAFCTPSTPIR